MRVVRERGAKSGVRDLCRWEEIRGMKTALEGSLRMSQEWRGALAVSERGRQIVVFGVASREGAADAEK